MRRVRPAADRVMEKVSPCPITGCWWWAGAVDEHGYGDIFWNGRTASAHRVLWEITRGAIPDGMRVLHRCDRPACVNPWHMFLGTQADNMADCVAKERIATGRRHGTHTTPESRTRGERSGTAKITASQAREIRERYVPGVSGNRGRQPNSASALSREFGIAVKTVRMIALGRLWAHL